MLANQYGGQFSNLLQKLQPPQAHVTGAAQYSVLGVSPAVFQVMNTSAQGHIISGPPTTTANISQGNGMLTNVPSGLSLNLKGYMNAGLAQGQGGFPISGVAKGIGQTGTGYIPPGGLGWLGVEMSTKTIDRNSIWVLGEEIDVECEIFPEVVMSKYNAVCTITVKVNSTSPLQATLKILEGKIYTSEALAYQDGLPNTVALLMNSQTLQGSSSTSVEWNGKWSDGTYPVPGPYVVQLILKRGTQEHKMFKRIMVH